MKCSEKWKLINIVLKADHAANVAEGLNYLVKGKDVRHLTIDEMQREVEAD